MAAHEIPRGELADHDPAGSRDCMPLYTAGARPDGTLGVLFIHHSYAVDARQEGTIDVSAGSESAVAAVV